MKKFQARPPKKETLLPLATPSKTRLVVLARVSASNNFFDNPMAKRIKPELASHNLELIETIFSNWYET